MKFLAGLFPAEVKIVEIEADTKLPELTGELRESLKVLRHNPAFNYLIQRARVQKAGVRRSLEQGANLEEVQLRFLQAGIFWLGFLERDIDSLTKTAAVQRPATDFEKEEFDKVAQQLELIS